MNLTLIAATILTSAADSLNPMAITQQFVLQGMVKKPGHIWYFILPTGITNFIGGLMAYYGLAAVFSSFLDAFLQHHLQTLLIAQFILGIAALMSAVYFVARRRIQEKRMENANAEESQTVKAGSEEMDEQRISGSIRSVTPPALIVLGVAATISELTTALPYFAFLAILLNYRLAAWEVIPILVLYNVIYTAPLGILYCIYRKRQALFERFYGFVKAKMPLLSAVLIPLLLAVLGAALVYHASIKLF